MYCCNRFIILFFVIFERQTKLRLVIAVDISVQFKSTLTGGNVITHYTYFKTTGFDQKLKKFICM